MKYINYKDMGKRIQEKRLDLGLTQERLSEKIDVSPSYISEIERGTSICSLEVLVNISRVLNLSLDYLVNGITMENVNTAFCDILENIPKKQQDLYISICKNIANNFK